MRRRENNDLTLRGWSAFFHRLAMFLLFPLRKPLIFFPILLILFLAPTFRGVKPAEVHLWYWEKLKSYTNDVFEIVKNQTKNALPENFELKLPLGQQENQEKKGNDKLVDYPVVDVNANRKAIFERASEGAFQPVDIQNDVVVDQNEAIKKEDLLIVDALTQLAEQVLQKEPTDDENLVSENKSKNPDNVQKKLPKKLPLVYLDEPKEVIGMAKVYNANELEVDGTYIFLYGIYVNPDTEDGFLAKKFLEDTLKNQIVRCSIVAYTLQDVATGMCYVGGENINQILVKKKFSKNVAL